MERDTREFARLLHVKTRVAGRMRLRIRTLSPRCSIARLNLKKFGK